jgi:excisionase family DNA binding protein
MMEKTKSKIVENYFEKLKQQFELKAAMVTRDELTALIREIINEEIVKLRSEFECPVQHPCREPEFLSVKEAAEYLNLAVATLYEKTSLKLIPFHKRDKKLYFKKVELKEWLLGKKPDAAVISLPIPKKHRTAA